MNLAGFITMLDIKSTYLPVQSIVLLQWRDTSTLMANYKKYGFSGVLAKPYEIDEIDETLQKVMKSM